VLVLDGTRIVAHSDAARAGKRLNRDDESDKALYDASARLRAIVGKNLDERDRNAALGRDAYAEYEVNKGNGELTLSVPAKREGRYAALVQVHARTVPPASSMPWMFVVPAVVAVAVFVGLSRMLRGWSLTGAGVALLVGVLWSQASLLAGWRADARLAATGVVARTIAELGSAGLLDVAPATAALPVERPSEPVASATAIPPPAEPPSAAVPVVPRRVTTAPESLVAALARTLDGAPSHDIVRVVTADQASAGAGLVSFAEAGYRVEYAASFFAAARATDLADLVRWSIGFGLAAVMGFILGVLGQLQRFGRAVVEHRMAYGYLAPAMVGMLVLVFIPMVFGLVIGFLERNYNVFEFAGLRNYIAILSDFNLMAPGNFYLKLMVTVLWTVLNVGLHVSIGLFLALLLNDEMLKARGIYRVILIIPWAIPNYITALIWKGMFHKQFGAVNFFLAALGFDPIAWFASFVPAFATNVVTNTWLGFPFMMVISLGALQSIPGDLYEAAWVDGASRWHRFRYITLPLLKPALVPAVIVGVVWTFNMFNIIYLVSGGAPDGTTDILITDAYRWAFERDRYGYAAAYSTLIFLILLAFTTATNRITSATKGAYE
jgi:ABC-type sugar transport system permease subunit